MKIGQMMPSKYLKKEDIDDEVLLTIQSVDKVNIAKENEKPQWKYAMVFEELSKPLLLNSTNINFTPAQQQQAPKMPGFNMQGPAPQDPFTPLGARGDSPFPIGTPNFQQASIGGSPAATSFGLRSRMMQGAGQSTMSPFAFL